MSERRSQAQRRAVMRDRVLDATIACVVEHGYADASTRRIAQRAGVSIGALQHHFDGKSELLAAAMQTVSARLAAEFRAEVDDLADSGGAALDRVAHLLDRVWAAHQGPLFAAGVELLVAARTDPALREAADDVAQAMSMQVAEGMLQAFPELVATPGFAENVLVGLATLRGLALMGLETGVDTDHLWEIARPQMLRTLTTLLVENDQPHSTPEGTPR